jgi:hypothetical protein
MAFPADDFGQDSSPSINEPVAYLDLKKIVTKGPIFKELLFLLVKQ